MKTNDQFGSAEAAMKFMPEGPMGDVAVGNVFRFPGPVERVGPLMRIAPNIRSRDFEAFHVARRTALYEGLVFAVVELSALVTIAITLVRAWRCDNLRRSKQSL